MVTCTGRFDTLGLCLTLGQAFWGLVNLSDLLDIVDISDLLDVLNPCVMAGGWLLG